MQQIDEIRKTGFRPGIVCAIINNRQILFLYKKEYGLWVLPQGSINNKELPKDAIFREIEEELGTEFLKECIGSFLILGEDKVEFTPDKYDVKELYSDAGAKLRMIGKHYYFYAVESKTQELDIKKTEYDDYFWLQYFPAHFLSQKIYQPGKRRIMVKCLSLLKEAKLLDV